MTMPNTSHMNRKDAKEDFLDGLSRRQVMVSLQLKIKVVRTSRSAYFHQGQTGPGSPVHRERMSLTALKIV